MLICSERRSHLSQLKGGLRLTHIHAHTPYIRMASAYHVDDVLTGKSPLCAKCYGLQKSRGGNKTNTCLKVN